MDMMDRVDLAARPLATAFAAFDPSKQPINEYRAGLLELFPIPPSHPGADYEEQFADGVRLLLYHPRKPGHAPIPAIYFIHPSGFISGAPEMFMAANKALAQVHGALVVTVQYRLAPETTFPAPLQDAYVGLAWLFRHAERLGVDRNRIVVTGESAGGGLAAMLALLARDRGEYPLAGQVLLYPMLDSRTGTDAAPVHNPTTGTFVWTERHNRFAWSALRGAQPIDDAWLPYFSPAETTDLAGLPPTFIAVGSLDLFLEEDVEYALRLSRAHVPMELRVYPGGIHAFNFVPSTITAQYMADLDAALTRMLVPPSRD